ncbi:peptidoglycan peptidase [Paracoccus alkanivorans]|uniref:Peptidoglycan peptidase n=1 Tax=Paracoccus alkanivorans TaxID=2116655 RepID=A0A3M0MEL2_9RHOB|nr:peptidoglycan peptidase [Paracoccus alkanivorans]RMC36029.1 peptidoglycan peptidase [Paracoccus alkanivorans]
MRNTFFSLLAATVSFWSWSASAEGETERFKEAEWDWHPGDLIFRNDINEFDELVRRADGAKWASVGILRSSSGGPRVLYVDEKAGVTEAMLYEFVDGLKSDDYAVYRIEDVDPNEPDKLMVQGPLASYAVLSAYGAPVDNHLLFGNGSYYNAELPFEAALSAGISLGSPRPIEELASVDEDLRTALLTRLQDHPYCVVALAPDNCWDVLKSISIATPSVLMASDHVRQVFPI